MAAASAVTMRIDRSLQSLLAEVEDLPNLAAEWDLLPDGARASIALDWDHLMASIMAELSQAYQSDAMSWEQQERYLLLISNVWEAMPIIDRLGFYHPRFSPTEELRAMRAERVRQIPGNPPGSRTDQTEVR
jgi:hypothetical protein